MPICLSVVTFSSLLREVKTIRDIFINYYTHTCISKVSLDIPRPPTRFFFTVIKRQLLNNPHLHVKRAKCCLKGSCWVLFSKLAIFLNMQIRDLLGTVIKRHLWDKPYLYIKGAKCCLFHKSDGQADTLTQDLKEAYYIIPSLF